MPTLRCCTVSREASSSPNQTRPVSGVRRPATTLSSVVLPEPEGPSSAMSSPGSASSDTPRSAAAASKARLTSSSLTATDSPQSMPPRPAPSSADHMTRLREVVAPLEDGLDDERDERQQREQRRQRERGDPVVLVVEDLDLQRDRVRLAADVAGDDGGGAELAHRARVAQQHAVEEPPTHVRQRDEGEDLPAAGAQRERRLLVLAAQLLHHRHELPGHERHGHEERGQHDAGHGEHDLDAARLQEGPKVALRAEQQEVDDTGDDGRDGERQVDERDEERLAAELELRH